MRTPKATLFVSITLYSMSMVDAGPDLVAVAGTTAPSEFQYTATIDGEFKADEPARVTLPFHILEKTHQDFSDLRIYDDSGKEVPYAIRKEKRPPVTPHRFTFKTLSYEAGETVETIVLEQPDDPVQFNAIEIETSARDFKKTVQVQSGSSLDEWNDLGEDAIFDFTSRINLRRNRIDFPITRAPYLKLTIERDTNVEATDRKITLEYEGLLFETGRKEDQPFRIDRIEGIYGPSKPEAFSFDEMSLPNPEISVDEDGNTLIHLGRINLPISSITINVNNTYFHRRAEVWTGPEDEEDAYRLRSSGDIYRIPGMATPELSLSGLEIRHPYITLKILNEDNPPLDIGEIELAWVRRIVFFFPEQGHRYAFHFGSENAERPAYETGKLLSADIMKRGDVQELLAGPTLEHTGFDPSLSERQKTRIQRIVLSLIVIVLLAGLSVWGYSMVKQLPPGGSRP